MTKLFFPAVLMLLVFGCATKEAANATKDSKAKQHIKTGPDNALKNGLEAYKVRDYDKAKSSLLKATQQKLSTNDLVSAHKHLAFIYSLQGKEDDAYKEFSNAFKLDKKFKLDKSETGHPAWTPSFQWAQKESALINAKGTELFDDGKAYYSKRDNSNAIRSLEAAVSKEDLKTSKKVEAYKLLAFIYAVDRNPAQAKLAFKKAFGLDNSFQLDKSEYGNPVWTPLYDEVKKQYQKK
ncbi:hypothetical protein JNM05_15705 [bacterium]|nr:hypothetical protein [bacterium]